MTNAPRSAPDPTAGPMGQPPRDETRHRREGRALTVAAVVLAAVACAPMWYVADGISVKDDWHTHYGMHLMMRIAVVEFGQFPVWAPWVGGGYPIVGHPEFPNLTPFVLPTLVFGEVVGQKIYVFLLVLIGALGMVALTHGTLRLGLAGSLVATCTFTLSGFLPGRVLSGNPVELHLLWFPLLIVLFERARTGRAAWPILVMAGILAVTVADGKWTTPTLGLMLGLWALTWCGRRKACSWRLTGWPLVVAVAPAVLALPLAAAKLLPLIDLLRRATTVAPYNPVRYSDVTSLLPGRLIDNLTVGWPSGKVLCLIGFVPLGLALAAVIRRPRWSARWAILGGVTVWLMIGRYAPIDLFGLLWRIPPFGNLSSSHKYFAPFLFVAVSVLAGRGAADIVAGRSRIARRLGLAAILALTAGPLLVRTAPAVASAFRFAPPLRLTRGNWLKFHQVRTDRLKRRGGLRPIRATAYLQLTRRAGLIDWQGTVLLPESAIPKHIIDADGRLTDNVAYPGAEVWCLSGGRAALTRLSPNVIEVRVETVGADRLIVNQNAQPGWRSSIGSVGEVNGLIAVDLPAAGVHAVRLRYHYRPFLWGLLISAVAWTAVAATITVEAVLARRRRRVAVIREPRDNHTA